MSITPKRWSEFQHYKDRSPVWIKLHRKLLDDFAFNRLPLASRALAPMLWLLASEYDDGKITATNEEIAFRLRTTEQDLVDALKPLIESGFFLSDSDPLAARKQSAIPEKETETQVETEEEKKDSSLRSDWPPDFREQFWIAYPRKSGKAGAIRELERVRKRSDVPWARVLSAVQAYAATADPQFTKHPKTWLHNGCWDDEPDVRKPNGRENPRNVLAAADRLVEKFRQFDAPAPAIECDVRDGASPPPVRAISGG